MLHVTRAGKRDTAPTLPQARMSWMFPHTQRHSSSFFWEAVGAVFSIVRSLFFGAGSFFCILLFCSSSRTALTGESVRIAVDLQHSKWEKLLSTFVQIYRQLLLILCPHGSSMYKEITQDKAKTKRHSPPFASSFGVLSRTSLGKGTYSFWTECLDKSPGTRA